jgi:hypothetical protein
VAIEGPRRLETFLHVAVCLLLTSCQEPVRVIDKEPARLSAFETRDPRAVRQLLAGFHQVEWNAWRWTAGRFDVALEPPSRDGVVLEVHLTVPEEVTKRRGAVTLSASIERVALEPATYEKPGEYVYSREVPAAALQHAPAVASFALDRFLKAGEVDQRELGIVVTSLALRPRPGTPRTQAGPRGRG